MIEELTLHALDELANPVLLCETSGVLFYKNAAAEKEFGRLQRQAALLSHLDGKSIAAFSSADRTSAFPLIATLSYLGEERYAFCDISHYERRPVVFFLFSPLLSYDLNLSFFRMTPSELQERVSAKRLLNAITASYLAAHPYPSGYDPTSRQVMTRLFRDLTAQIVQDIAYGEDTLFLRLDKAMDILVYAARTVFGKIGISLLVEAPWEWTSTRLVDFKPLALLLSQLFLYAVEFSDGALLRLTVESESENELRFTLVSDQSFVMPAVDHGGIGKLSEFLPGRCVDLFLFEKLCHSRRYRFDFSLKASVAHNLCLRLFAPCYPTVRLRQEKRIDTEEIQCRIDRFCESANIPREVPHA